MSRRGEELRAVTLSSVICFPLRLFDLCRVCIASVVVSVAVTHVMHLPAVPSILSFPHPLCDESCFIPSLYQQFHTFVFIPRILMGRSKFCH